MSWPSMTRFRVFCAVAWSFGVAGVGVLACGGSTFSADEGGDASTADGASDAAGDSLSLGDVSLPDVIDEPAALGFCQSQTSPPYLCMDFDESNVLRAFRGGSSGVATKVTTGSGVVLQQSGGLSLPDVLATTIAASSNGANALVSADMTASATATHFRLDLDFRIDSLGTITSGQEVSFFSITLANPTAASSTQYAAIFHNGTFAVRISGATETNLTLGTPSVNVWTHAMFDFQLPSHTFLVDINSVTGSETSGNTAITETAPTVAVGLAAVAGGTPAAGISYDNVTLIADNAGLDGG